MRYIVIFGVTLALVLVILFYNPFLGTYNKTVTFDFGEKEEGYKWDYIIKGDSLEFDKTKNNKFRFKSNGIGNSTIIFTYSNQEDAKYEVKYKFKVFAGLIFWKECVGSGVYNYPNPY